ncbi:hypothetical protein [Candidatus Corynebacterium faecigallinarum]|uniref:hypothetical protein n=1 Tax=Candidatus Corynebacterium faecigallinarum TaxID=2838528 RepID=UPI003FD5D377
MKEKTGDEGKADPPPGLASSMTPFMAWPWVRLAPSLEAAFGHLGPQATVLDIGAGPGVGTIRLTRSTHARIVAIEPSLIMRTGLLARIEDDEDLSARVSVLAGSVPTILDEIDAPVRASCAHTCLATSLRASVARPSLA